MVLGLGWGAVVEDAAARKAECKQPRSKGHSRDLQTLLSDTGTQPPRPREAQPTLGVFEGVAHPSDHLSP